MSTFFRRRSNHAASHNVSRTTRLRQKALQWRNSLTQRVLAFQQVRAERLRRWRRAFPIWRPLNVSAFAAMFAGVWGWLTGFGRVVGAGPLGGDSSLMSFSVGRGTRPTSRRSLRKGLQSEPLEQRAMLAVLYVDNSPGMSGTEFTASGGSQPASFPGLTPGADIFSTIGAAIAFASANDTINVADGTYTENIIVNKSLTLRGNQYGIDARGRTGGSPSPASESIISPASGRPLELQDPADNTTINGFSIVGAFNSSTGAVESTTGPTDQLQFLNNYVAVATGFTATPLYLNKGALDATIDRNEFSSPAAGSQAVLLDAPDQFQGLHFTNNNVLRTGGGGTGLFVDGNHNVSNTGSVNTPLIKGNLFQGFSAGANLGRFAFANGEISENNFNLNTGVGLQGGIQNTLIKRNTFTGSGTSAQGLQLTPILADPTDINKGAFGNTVSENFFSGNPINDIFLSDGEAPGLISTNIIHNNSLTSAVGVFYRGSEAIDASQNYWGTNTAAGVAAKIQTVNNERQWLGIKSSVTGSMVLSYNGNPTAALTTSAASGTPSAATVKAELELLPGIGAGNVQVTISGSSLVSVH